jgi:probable phosphoglycerate mutase
VTRLIIWRHGLTEWNSLQRVQGHTDVDLNDAGRAQAAAAAKRLADYQPQAIVSSDLRRAAATADALAALTGLPVSYDKRLRERDFGQWQGLTMPEVIAAFPEAYQRWRAGADDIGECGIESVTDLRTRSAAALRDAVIAGATVVVVCHGGTAKHGTAELIGWDQATMNTFTSLGNCHWIDLRQAGDGWRIHAYNHS